MAVVSRQAVLTYAELAADRVQHTGDQPTERHQGRTGENIPPEAARAGMLGWGVCEKSSTALTRPEWPALRSILGL